MIVYFNNTVIYERKFQDMAEVDELMIEEGAATSAKHDVVGFGLAIVLFLIGQVTSKARASASEKRMRAFVSEIDKRAKGTNESQLTDEKELAKVLWQLREEGSVTIHFDSETESDLKTAFDKLGDYITKQDPP